MRKLLGLGLCLALAACAGQPVKKPAKCDGRLRPANPYGLTLPTVPAPAPARPSAPADVDVFKQNAPATLGAEPGDAAPSGNEQSDAGGRTEVPRLSASLRSPIYSNC